MALLVIYIGLYIAFLITSPFITLFHELGHGVAYLVLTKPDNINIYIGSYGKSKKAFQLKMGRFTFHIKYSFPLVKSGGKCSSSKVERNYINYLIILFAGPLSTVIIAVLIGFLFVNSNAHGLIKLFGLALILFSVIGLFTNLKPRTIKTANGNFDNDGKQIIFVWKLKSRFSDYIDSVKLVNEKEYVAAINKLKDVLQATPGENKILILLVSALLETGSYDEADFFLLELEKKVETEPTVVLLRGCLQSFTNKSDEAILSYRKVLAYDYKSIVALNNLGYQLTEKGNYDEAEKLLQEAINLMPDWDHVYGSMGYLKILQGETETGKEFIDKCLELNSENAYAYKALGVYYLRMNDAEHASFNFRRSIELDKRIDLGKYAGELKLSITS